MAAAYLYMTFLDYQNRYLAGDGSVVVARLTDYLGRPLGTTTAGANPPAPNQVFQPDLYGLDVEQTLNIGPVLGSRRRPDHLQPVQHRQVHRPRLARAVQCLRVRHALRTGRPLRDHRR